jgi:hypothetical protein
MFVNILGLIHPETAFGTNGIKSAWFPTILKGIYCTFTPGFIQVWGASPAFNGFHATKMGHLLFGFGVAVELCVANQTPKMAPNWILSPRRGSLYRI